MGGLTRSALNRLEKALDLDTQYEAENEQESTAAAENPTFVAIDVADSDADWLAQFSEEHDRAPADAPLVAPSPVAPLVTRSTVAPPALVDPSLDTFSDERDTDTFRPKEATEAVSSGRLDRREPRKTARWLRPAVVIAILGVVTGSLIGLFSSSGMLRIRVRNQSPRADMAVGTSGPIRPQPQTQRQTQAQTQAQTQTEPPIASPAVQAPAEKGPPPEANLQNRTAKTDSLTPRSPSLQPPPSRVSDVPVSPPATAAPLASPSAVRSQTPPETGPDVPATSLTTVMTTGSIPPGPPPAETPRPPEAPKSVSENSAIYMVLGRYQSAFNDLNASVAKSVWPSVDERTLARAFDGLEHQEVVFDSCQIEVAGGRAIASCRGRAQYVPKVGNKGARLQSRHWTFRLSNGGSGWIIDSVESR